MKGGRLSVATRGSLPALLLAAAGVLGTSCDGDDFCAEGSYECAGSSAVAGTSGSGGSAADGGSGGSGNSGGSGGTAAGGNAAGGTAGNGGAAGDGAGGEGGAAGNGPQECDPDAPELGCVVSESLGIFVSPDGDDGAVGTEPDAPVQSVARAVQIANATHSTIYVCAGTYRENVVVARNGLALRGGYSCKNGVFTYDGTKASITAREAKEVLRVEGVTSLAVSDLELTARNATEPGASSVAVFVTKSSDVRFERLDVVAGAGAAGADGKDGVTLGSNWTTQNLDGNAANGTTGGPYKDCVCGDGSTTKGGSGGAGSSATGGGNGEPDLGAGEGGTLNLSCSSGGGGSDGNPAESSSDASGAATRGVIDAEAGWLPTAGGDGLNGGPGQGGGGGAGGTTGGGGGGGCGGCGGRGGGGGQGGGASIGILVADSVVSVTDSTLTIGDAGDGGLGAAAQPGQDGGDAGVKAGLGCSGGVGGKGGAGGPGGGGAGGISVGILSNAASELTTSDTMIELGAPGAGGLGAGENNAGVSGLAAEKKVL